jgi:hypothetical protein
MNEAARSMFSVQRLSKKIEELCENRSNLDAFEDWFVSESWGHYSVQTDAASSAIAAVHHVLHSYEDGEIDERQVAKELANAIRPFAPSPEFRYSGRAHL